PRNGRQRMSEPRALVEHFFRHEFGRLCAVLTRSLGVRRLELVEDIVQAALVQALETWSRRGVPEDPSGWLYRTARNHHCVSRISCQLAAFAARRTMRLRRAKSVVLLSWFLMDSSGMLSRSSPTTRILSRIAFSCPSSKMARYVSDSCMALTPRKIRAAAS